MLLLSAKSPSPGRWENTFTNGDLENHLKAKLFRLVQWLNIILFLRRTSQGSTNLVNSFTWNIPRIRIVRGRIWKRDVVVADIEELEMFDASEIHARRLNAKEMITPKNGDFFMFPIEDGTVKLFGIEIMESENKENSCDCDT